MKTFKVTARDHKGIFTFLCSGGVEVFRMIQCGVNVISWEIVKT